MANPIIELDPVTHITAGALGQPGHRTFFIQAERGANRIDLLCEKTQVEALADAIDEMVQNLETEFGLERHADLKPEGQVMAIKEPVDPLFRVGAMGLGYDANRDRILLVAQEALTEERGAGSARGALLRHPGADAGAEHARPRCSRQGPPARAGGFAG